VSAPTVRFLRLLEELRRLPDTQRRKIAAGVLLVIGPLFARSDADALRQAARGAQDERWRLISEGTRDQRDVDLARVTLTEQWILAHLEIAGADAFGAQTLAEKRCAAVEAFVAENVAPESFDMIEFSLAAVPRRLGQGNRSGAAPLSADGGGLSAAGSAP